MSSKTKLKATLRSVFVLAVALSGNAIFAQSTAEKKPTPTPERNRQIVALLNDARIAAPELAVDTFLKVVESKKVTDPVWRREILEEALRMTGDVKYPIRMNVVFFPRSAVDTRAGYLSYAFDQKLDALSLKARILKLLLPVDTARAKQIVYQMNGDLGLKRLTCEDTMAYHVDDIYSAVAAVAKAVFTPKEVRDGVRGLFVLPWIENIESPAQITPAMELIRDLIGSPNESQMLFAAFGRAINRNFNDDRSFSHAMARDRILATFATLNRSRALSEQMTLSDEFREFLLKNTTGTRCLDNKPEKKDQLPAIIADANFFYADHPFVLENFESVEYKGSAKVVHYLRSEMAVKMLDKFRKARDKKNDPAIKDDKDAQLEWELKVGEMLEDLVKWEPEINEPEADVFAEKCVYYRSIAGEVPEGKLRETVMRAFLRYLNGSSMLKMSFIEWLYHAKWLAEKYPVLFNDVVRDFPNANFDVFLRSARSAM